MRSFKRPGQPWAGIGPPIAKWVIPIVFQWGEGVTAEKVFNLELPLDATPELVAQRLRTLAKQIEEEAVR